MISLPIFAVLLLCGTVLAANNKEQKPEKTPEPTTVPSSSPSQFPTEMPTISFSPTTAPSQFPSSAPSPVHSEYPTNFPTIQASKAPSTSPTMRNTLKAEVYGAVIPIMTFDVVLSDEEAVLSLTRDMDSFFTMFLDRILDENSGMYDFDYSHMDSNVIVSSFQHGDRRRLETGYSIKIDGIAYYFGDAPTRGSLLHSIRLYFNFWGKGDLEEYLHRLGLKSAIVASATIDDEQIDIHSDKEPSIGANVSPLDNVETQRTSLPRTIAILIYITAILLIPTTALLVIGYGRRRRRQEEKKASYWKSDNQSVSETSQSEAVPQNRQQHDEEQSFSDHVSSHDSGYSITKSLASANVSISGSNAKDNSDTSALVACGTYQ